MSLAHSLMFMRIFAPKCSYSGCWTWFKVYMLNLRLHMCVCIILQMFRFYYVLRAVLFPLYL